jgi:D-tagatose-1,6-bisphosphate aldolase subunit GatZ/KbaZ
MSDPMSETVHRHKAGQPVGIPSVCSAHPLVLRAAVQEGVATGGVVLIEATSNQVDQFGGYTGMRPPDFRDLVLAIADGEGLPRDRVVLGGDHLGPNSWRGRPAEEAMANAEQLVQAYVEAGYTKIHLDCSMACAGDPTPLPDEVVAERAARLAAVAERTGGPLGAAALSYVIGTEVPVPGGAREAIDALTPTSPEAARDTLRAHEDAFARAGVPDGWERVLALVVQPGVEFDATHVVDYDRSRTAALREVVEEHPSLIFEAHSTDYQTIARLTELVEDHWAVLKVGPGLTFALREALFALAAIEDELVVHGERSELPAVVEQVMVTEPRLWKGYYEGDEDELRLARRYSFSDRLRYYWPDPRIAAAQERLFANLREHAIPLPLLSAFLPDQYTRVRAGELTADPEALAIDRVRDVLRGYWAACGLGAPDQRPDS